MLKKISLGIVLSLIFPLTAQAYGIRDFLATAGRGVVVGTVLGVASLALEDKPSENWNNVARGASLGLYAGVAWGAYRLNQAESDGNSLEESYQVFFKPIFSQDRKLEGLIVQQTLFSF